MSSVLERPSLNKIFLLCGNLDDMFLSPDLQKNNFRPFLNSYLRSLGYERIVFYSGAKNTGKYVLDDRSAVLAINKNRNQQTADTQNTSDQSQGKNKRRILSPRAREAEAVQPASTPLGANENLPADNAATQGEKIGRASCRERV